MVIVDTNVLAYLLLDGIPTPSARALRTLDPDWHTESFALVECSNVLATHVRVGGLTATEAGDLLAEIEELVRDGLHTVALETALEFAVRYSVSAYDARFLALADELGGRLVTEDAKLRKAAPDLTRSLAEALKDIAFRKH